MSCFLAGEGCALAGSNECTETECPYYGWHDHSFTDIYPQKSGHFFGVEIKHKVEYLGKTVIGFATNVLFPGIWTVKSLRQKNKPVGRKKKGIPVNLSLSRGTKKRDVIREMNRQVIQNIDRAIAVRLKQYDNLNRLTSAVQRHYHEAALWTVWRHNKDKKIPNEVESYFEEFLESIGLNNPENM